ncbi:DNA helicase UvrD [archaeon]|nr:DNA helicase UvrD [archaeon]|tara:strand:+ start:1212 stop:2444 length:1233 start_codon:yes stop_codon:yes gene_type:complete
MTEERTRADLHIHSHYSRATSPQMNIEALAGYAKVKGIDVLGTGDFTHPLWLKEMKEKLAEDSGLYSYDDLKFMLTAEISLIYSQESELDEKKGRRIHIVMLAPNFDIVDQINEMLLKIGRTDYDGRPIFGRSCIEMTENLMQISKDIEVIPAHVWTPWFGLFGSKGGFNTVKDCFQDKTKYIHALETGLSSDPAMNWRLSNLDKYTLVSFSDSHSPWPWRLGRECCVMDMKNINYNEILKVIRTKKGFDYTIEVDPGYGKYHEDGHRKCNIHFTPEESKKHGGICPVCKRDLTIGVLNRVEELADRPEGYELKGAIPFKTLLPLHEIISAVKQKAVATKTVGEIAEQFMKIGTELDILENIDEKKLSEIDEKIAKIIIQIRNGNIKIDAGYDGVYGKLILDKKKTLKDF